MERLSRVARDRWFEFLIAALAVAGMLELVVGRGSPGAPALSLWVSIPAIGMLVTPLLVSRRFPFAGPAAYWVLAAALTFVDGLLVPFVGSLVVVGMATAFLLGHLRSGVRSGIGLMLVVASILTVVRNIPGSQSVSLFVFIPLRFAASWVAGYALRERSEQAAAAELRAVYAERAREASARVAVAEERARIARELHDIVAHAVSVMVLQVGAVRRNLPSTLDDDKEALGRVERAGRTALAEMRRLLGAMRRTGDEIELEPQPGIDGLDSLVDDIGRAGLPVQLHIDGAAVTVPRAIDLSAYRIVQEGLTNSLKHARATHADVTVRYLPGELEIEVVDDGVGTTSSDGLGHGLVGIRERVRIYGGEMRTRVAPGGGFLLSARLPFDRYRR